MPSTPTASTPFASCRRDEPSGEHRRRGARDALMGLRRLVLVDPGAFPI
jgi:hypothetical protein